MFRVALSLAAIVTISASAIDHVEPSSSKGPDLRFQEEGRDLLVHLTIEGPAARQIIVTDFSIFDGTPPWDEPPIGVDKPKRQPRVELRYLCLINKDIPGFTEKSLMTPPTPEFVRKTQRHNVTWRMPNYPDWGFKREQAKFTVDVTNFEAYSEQLQKALPKIKATIDAHELRKKNEGPPPA